MSRGSPPFRERRSHGLAAVAVVDSSGLGKVVMKVIGRVSEWLWALLVMRVRDSRGAYQV